MHEFHNTWTVPKHNDETHLTIKVERPLHRLQVNANAKVRLFSFGGEEDPEDISDWEYLFLMRFWTPLSLPPKLFADDEELCEKGLVVAEQPQEAFSWDATPNDVCTLWKGSNWEVEHALL